MPTETNRFDPFGISVLSPGPVVTFSESTNLLPFGTSTSSPPNAFTTALPRPASATTMMKRIAAILAAPLTGPISAFAICARLFPLCRNDAARIKILHRSRQTHADQQPNQPRRIPKLRRQLSRPDQRPPRPEIAAK